MSAIGSCTWQKLLAGPQPDREAEHVLAAGQLNCPMSNKFLRIFNAFTRRKRLKKATNENVPIRAKWRVAQLLHDCTMCVRTAVVPWQGLSLVEDRFLRWRLDFSRFLRKQSSFDSCNADITCAGGSPSGAADEPDIIDLDYSSREGPEIALDVQGEAVHNFY